MKLEISALHYVNYNMTSSNGNTFRVAVPFMQGIHRWPVDSLTKGQERGHLVFLCRQSEGVVEQTLDRLVIRDAMAVIWRRRNVE